MLWENLQTSDKMADRKKKSRGKFKKKKSLGLLIIINGRENNIRLFQKKSTHPSTDWILEILVGGGIKDLSLIHI